MGARSSPRSASSDPQRIKSERGPFGAPFISLDSAFALRANVHFAAALLLAAGAAEAESAGADADGAGLDGDAASGLPPPQAATMIPAAAMAARSATSAMFFIFLFSSSGHKRRRGQAHLCQSLTLAVNWASY